MLGKCLGCNKLFAMKKIEKKLVKQEDVEILETLTQPHPSGEIQTMEERFVLGKRNVYKITYSCRLCGAQHSKYVYKNIKNAKDA